MKKGCIFSVIFIALLAGCTTKNNNEDIPNAGDNGTTDTDSKELTYEKLFDPKSKIDIELKFTVLNNKKLSLTNVPINLMRTVYGIIDYGRAIHNFSYKFGGAGTVEDVREKVEDYMQTGCKQILATPAEQSFKWLSIVFFLLGIFFLYTFKDILSDSETALISIVALPAFGFIAVSFIFDFFLLADKWNENRYKRF